MGQSREIWSLTKQIIAVITGVVLLLGAITSLVRLAPAVYEQVRSLERIEMAEAGFAISLPRDWQHEGATAYHVDWWDSAVGDTATQHEKFLDQGGVLLARKPTWTEAGHEQCLMYSLSGSEAQAHVNTADDDPRVTTVEIARMELPGGDAIVYDLLRDDGHWRQYLITDGERWLLLECGSMTPPEDRWLSIADTVEFLPAEG